MPLGVGPRQVEDAHIHDLEITINRLTSPPTAKARFLAIGKGRDRKNEFPYHELSRRVVVNCGGKAADGWSATSRWRTSSASTMRHLLTQRF